MPANRPAPAAEKTALHPRNPHRARYDFPALVGSSPALAAFVRPTGFGEESVDFSNPAAVKALNQALLQHFYGIGHWDIPPGYLCPPIPGRADYVHYLADLLADGNAGTVPTGPAVRVLDVGTGANCIYPILGSRAYGWQFVGTDTDPIAVRNAQRMVAANPLLAGIAIRLQPRFDRIFDGLLRPDDAFDLTMCNPPFHASAAEAAAGTQRKINHLSTQKRAVPALNFGGKASELWCAGGEAGFVERLVAESAAFATQCRWFTTLISQKTTLPGVYAALRRVQATEVCTVAMAQGQKISRFVAWTFLDSAQQAAWRAARWGASNRPLNLKTCSKSSSQAIKRFKAP